MKRKKLFTAGLVFVLFLIGSLAEIFVRPAQANPNPLATISVYAGNVPTPYDAETPEISLLSPMNQSCHSTNNIAFSVNVSFSGKSLYYDTTYGLDENVKVSIDPSLREVYFEADWLDRSISTDPNQPINLRLNGIPEGKHSLVVYAVGWSPYRILYTEPYGLGKLLYYNGYNITSCLSISFTVDTIPPQISILSLVNKSFNVADFSLNFTVNEAVSEVAYSLDGQSNVTIGGNTTLTNLPYGEHNLALFATDEVGNIGASKTIFFTVQEPPPPFPTTLVFVSVITIAVIGLGLVYFKKRKH